MVTRVVHFYSKGSRLEGDYFLPAGYRELHERAREPKKLVGLPITHYEIYAPPRLDESAKLAIDWFDRYLKPV
jgi:hypothetical protein